MANMRLPVAANEGQESNQDSAATNVALDSSAPAPLAAARLHGALVLSDGVRVRVRPIRPDDTARLRAFHAHLSPMSVISRFFRYMPELSQVDAEHFTHVDYKDRMAFVATHGIEADERILAVVSYDRIAPTSAEVAFVTADAWQGHGLATALLRQLATYAMTQNITRFIAIIMPSNTRMLNLLRHCGYPIKTRYESGQDETSIDLTVPPDAEAVRLPFTPDASADDSPDARPI
jgi:RimJ/RimL family protein N-acetyltransferase